MGDGTNFDSSLPLGYADMAVLLTSKVDEAAMAPHDSGGPPAYLQSRSKGCSGVEGMPRRIDETAGSSIDLPQIRIVL